MSLFNVDPDKEKHLYNFLNFTERGGDIVIIHPGSHTIKFGLASQSQPFMIPNVIAYRTKTHIHAYDPASSTNEAIQQVFDNEIESILPEVNKDLLDHEYSLIDSKRAQKIKSRNVSYKIFDESNAVQIYPDKRKGSDYEEVDIFSTNLNAVANSEKFTFFRAHSPSPPSYIVGQGALDLEASENYKLCYPVRYGHLNTKPGVSATQCCDDLEKILEYAFETYMRLPKKNV